jgi:hypothetical protein
MDRDLKGGWWYNRCTIRTFAWKDWGEPWRILGRIACVMVRIRRRTFLYSSIALLLEQPVRLPKYIGSRIALLARLLSVTRDYLEHRTARWLTNILIGKIVESSGPGLRCSWLLFQIWLDMLKKTTKSLRTVEFQADTWTGYYPNIRKDLPRLFSLWSPADYFLVLSPMGPITTFFCLMILANWWDCSRWLTGLRVHSMCLESSTAQPLYRYCYRKYLTPAGTVSKSPMSPEVSYLTVKVILRPTVSRPVCPGVRPQSVNSDKFLLSLPWKLSSESCWFLTTGRPLWWEDRSVIYSCCFASPAQLFWGLPPTWFMTIFCCINCEIPPTWRARSLYIFPPGRG